MGTNKNNNFEALDNVYEEELGEEYKFTRTTSKEIDDETNEQLKAFSDLMTSLPIDEKLKILWTQIFKNAIFDRRNALIAWNDLYSVVHGKSEQHTVNGDRLAKYMERMEKANAQLLKLSEYVQKSKSMIEEEIDGEDEGFLNKKTESIFDKFEKKSKTH